jgi:hypothetical protein
MERVLLETPTSGNRDPEIYERFAKACIRDSVLRKEAPLSVFLLYKQSGILYEENPGEKALGKLAASEWNKLCTKIIVYKDLGVTKEMQRTIDDAIKEDYIVEYRILNDPELKNNQLITDPSTIRTGIKTAVTPSFLKFT